jgi:hypothetical protein
MLHCNMEASRYPSRASRQCAIASWFGGSKRTRAATHSAIIHHSHVRQLSRLIRIDLMGQAISESCRKVNRTRWRVSAPLFVRKADGRRPVRVDAAAGHAGP